MDVLLNFARLSDAQSRSLRRALDEAGLRVVAIASHRGERPDRFGSDIRVEHWHDYSERVAALPWDDGDPFDGLMDPDQLLQLLAVVERPAPRLGGIAESLWRAHCDLARARRLLADSGAEAIISIDDPESGLDVCLEALTRSSGVRRLWIRRGLTGFARCAGTDPFTPILAEDGRPSDTILPIGLPAGASGSRARSAVAAMTSGEDPGVLPAAERRRIRRRTVADLIEQIARRIPAIAAASKHRPLVSGPSFIRELRRDLLRHAGKIPARSKVCLLALHYQPELSTLTMGGWGTRQLEVARFLAEHLPADWHLAVQEHPSTFWARSTTSATFRPPAFYARIAALPRTTLLPPPEGPQPPPTGTDLVVTASGTMGAEALARGTPVIHLGRAPYTHFPGAGWLRRPDPRLLRSLLDEVTALGVEQIRDGFLEASEVVASVSFAATTEAAIDGMVEACGAAIPLWLATE